VFLFGFTTYCTVAAADENHVVVMTIEVSVPEELNFHRETASVRT
jgi:hypothetical protein